MKRETLFYNFACNFIYDEYKISPDCLKIYFEPDNVNRVSEINDIFKYMIVSAQNRQGLPNLIGGEDGVNKLCTVLFDFSPLEVFENYNMDVQKLLSKTGLLEKYPSSKRNLTLFCTSILSCSNYLKNYNTANSFLSAMHELYDNRNGVAPLSKFDPVFLLASNVNGFGFALACDFFKELGFVDYAKPDTHIIDILMKYKFYPEKDKSKISDIDKYVISRIMLDMATEIGITAYELDKVLWLIGSGNFYKNKELGKNGKLGSKKNKFLSLSNEFNST